jgi:ATP-dependent RNA helicase DHX8/PRP22
MSARSPSNSKSPSSRNSQIAKNPSIHLLNEEDLELDNEDEIIIPYEILNPNESLRPLTEAMEHNHPRILTPKNSSSSSPPFSGNKNGDQTETDFDVLPIEVFREKILDILANNQIMICIGETGSGKTTQIPQFFMKAGLLKDKKMAVTQPRRIAAISVAKRVSEEMNVSLGEEVGYIVRFDDMTKEGTTKIKFMTDGILIRECLSDPLLQQYSIIMLDEAHERSLNTDILFGLLKSIIHKRKDLKLIVTSATLDAEKFSSYFFHCPILQIPGRNYPVDIYHSKTKQIMTINGPSNTSYIQTAVDVVLKIHQREEDGHILVFLTGQEEIEKACLILRNTLQQWKSSSSTSRQSSENQDENNPEEDERRRERLKDRELVILPLYAALSNEDQVKIFQKPQLLLSNEFKGKRNNNTSSGGNNKRPGEKDSLPRIIRKCVIATNIAETSITVPHVRFVVDAGYVKQKVYDPTRGMESLVVVPTSKIAALQRAGR